MGRHSLPLSHQRSPTPWFLIFPSKLNFCCLLPITSLRWPMTLLVATSKEYFSTYLTWPLNSSGFSLGCFSTLCSLKQASQICSHQQQAAWVVLSASLVSGEGHLLRLICERPHRERERRRNGRGCSYKLWGCGAHTSSPYEMLKRVSRGIVIRTSNLSLVLPTGCEQTRQN